jgi:protein TIF31
MQEMVFRGAKHILRSLLHGLSAEHSIYALTHFLNCLFGADKNANPTAIFEAYDFLDMPAPAYTKLTPESLRKQIQEQVQTRFRWQLDESFLTTGLKKQQLLRELATRTAFQLEQREYSFTATAVEDVTAPEQESGSGKTKKGKKSKTEATADLRLNTFEPSDIVTLLPVIKSCAPSVSIYHAFGSTCTDTPYCRPP